MSQYEQLKGSLRYVDENVSEYIRIYRDTNVGKYLPLSFALLWVGIFLLIPTLIYIDYSLGNFPTFTLEHFRDALYSPLYQSVAIRVVWIAALVTLLSFLLGFPLAYTATRSRGWLGKVIVLCTLAPLSIDLILRSLGWRLLLTNQGLIPTFLRSTGLISPVPKLVYNEAGIVIGMVHVMLPFMFFPILNILHTIPESLEEAARNLGASRIKVFTKILFPLALPGIAAGMLITFGGTMATYVTPQLLGGRVRVLPMVVVDLVTLGDYKLGSALAIELVVIGIAAIIIYQKLLDQMKSARFNQE